MRYEIFKICSNIAAKFEVIGFMFKRGGVLFLLLVFVIIAKGQSTLVLDNLPPSVKWQQIKTPNFKIIYPEGFKKQGLRMANTLERIHQPVAKSMGLNGTKPIPIILQNQNLVSNGFVTLGPRRSEFFTSSPQRANLVGNNDWLDMLALHEYRHVVQFERSRTGFTGFIRTIFGEYSQGAVAGSSVPSWFWEGDAVGIETALSSSGRGRIPQFSASFRANLLERGAFNYNKAYLRSFKDFIPNHYVLGYFYATYLKNSYGEKSLENMVDKTWSMPYVPFSFSFSQKMFGGKKMPAMYQSMMVELKDKWQNQLQGLEITSFEKINTKRKKVYTNYNYPQALDNGNILALKSGLGDYARLVEVNVNTGDEHVVYTPGVLNDAGMLSARDGIIVWNEFNYDPRWRQRTYSVIKLFNMGTGVLRQIGEKSRYTAAALSPDRTKLATIEQTSDYKNTLVILDAYSGQRMKSIPAPEGSLLTNPVWTDSTSIVVAEVYDRRKKILEINTANKEISVLLEPTLDQISYAVRHNEFLFFVSGMTEIDNIYAKDLSSGILYQVTSSKFGATNFTFSKDEKYIYYSELNSLGNDIARIPYDKELWTAVEDLEDTRIQFYASMVENEGNATILDSIPEIDYDVSRYRKKAVKLHSWGPLVSPTATDLEVGLYSTNVLSTTDLFLGFQTDQDLNFKWIARGSYQGLYPILDIEANYAKRNASVTYRDTASGANRIDQIKWNETGIKGGLRIPWILTKSKYFTNLEVRNYVGYTAVRDYQSSAFGSDRYYLYFSRLGNGNLLNNEFRVLFSSLHTRSRRDIQSKWGIVLVAENFSTPYGGDYDGGLTSFRGQFYVPGLAKHHSLNFFAGYQHNKITLDNNNYWFANRMPYPRGVRGSTFEDFYALRANYDLPLLYPDLSLGPWIYIQRIKAKLFYDYGFGSTTVNNPLFQPVDFSRQYYSTGMELTFDFNFMRALPILELGVRYSYLPDQGSGSFEFLIGSFGF